MSTSKKPRLEMTENISMFGKYAQMLDNKHARRERLIKASRDVTNDSKKLIFLLHRQVAEIPRNFEEAHQKLQAINDIFLTKIAPDVQGGEYYNFHRSFSGAVQEYVEACALLQYLETETVITLEQCEEQLNKTAKEFKMHLEISDYCLGIADFTGELMRICVSAVGAGDIETPQKICTFLKEIQLGCGRVVGIHRDMAKKMVELDASVKKTEKVCYAIKIRGAENVLALSNAFADDVADGDVNMN